jgi:hypothetical protein
LPLEVLLSKILPLEALQLEIFSAAFVVCLELWNGLENVLRLKSILADQNLT